jgi:hypothetical protein
LFDIHRNGDAFGYAARQRASFRGLGDTGSFVQLSVNFGQHDLNRGFDDSSVHGGSFSFKVPPHTLFRRTKSS